MNQFNVGDKATYTDNGKSSTVTLTSYEGCPVGSVLVTDDATGANGMVKISKLTEV